ncbi:MAG TPA: transglutaminase domain-containing protein [Chthonomonadaceae bacterium]|nr:transglutaminase domain-containing protein [Chthonomonadaceae bacterium]
MTLEVSSPVPYREAREPKFGNRMVYLHVEKPQAPLTVNVRFTVTRKAVEVLGKPGITAENPVPKDALESEEVRRLLEPDKKVPIGGRYGQIAHEVTAGKTTSLDQVHAIFDHVVATMQYDYKKESPKYAQGDVAFVCDYKKGNCSDLHSYIISLARSLHIPAVLEFGFPLTGIPVPDPLPKEGTIGGYHCWTWFRDPTQGWVPLDASDARRWLDSGKPEVRDYLFGNLVLARSAVVMSCGRDITLDPPQKAGPLNYFIYPYAEADGKPVEAKWELSFRRKEAASAAAASPAPQAQATSSSPVSSSAGAAAALADPARQDLQQQIDELRRLVEEQRQEIAQLRQQVGPLPAPPAKPPTIPTVASRERVSVYGFLRLDTIWDSGATNNSQTPFFVQSPSSPNVTRAGNSVLTLHPRLTRLGLNFAAPPDTLKGYNITGKFEMDWQNGSGLTPESRPLLRIRHAYLQLQRGASSLLLGQTWDIISPLYPSPNDDTLMWNAGNLGDRRPQIRYAYDPTTSPFNLAFGVGLASAVDNQDLDTNGIRDGEDSGLPNVQMRLGWKSRTASAGVWGHYAWETATKMVAGQGSFPGYSIGLDLLWQPTARWDLRGELWTGQNLSDFRGGIGQGVNPTTGLPIRSSGGWVEAGFQPTRLYRIALGYTLDSPNVRDIPAGGRTRNDAIYLANRWRIGGNTSVGLNYLFWTTQYKGLATGTDHRLDAFVQHDF